MTIQTKMSQVQNKSRNKEIKNQHNSINKKLNKFIQTKKNINIIKKIKDNNLTVNKADKGNIITIENKDKLDQKTSSFQIIHYIKN